MGCLNVINGAADGHHEMCIRDSFMTYYYSAAQTQRAFGPRFRRVRLQGLSVFTPTADNKTFAVNHPRLYRGLVGLDDRLSGRFPFNGWGDFFILTMEFTG